MPNFMKALLGIKKENDVAEKLHEANIKEMEKTTKKIEKLNKLLVRRSVAYKIHLVTGCDKV